MEIDQTTEILLWGFGLATILGAAANKTNFCTMGAVSDWVNMGDKGRIRAWLLAIAVALLGSVVLETMEMASMDSTIPPYRTSQFAWLRFIVGGLIFGVGMTLASGCGNKNLVRIGGGNIKSLFVIGVTGYFAYLMTKTAFYEKLFHGWVSATTIDLSAYDINGQDIGTMLAAMTGMDVADARMWLGGIIAVLILFMVLRHRDFRTNLDNVLGGLIVGLVIIGAWYVTGGPGGQEWIEAMEWEDEKPINVGVQSFTFINPTGELLVWLADPKNNLLISFGVASLFGVIAGSFIWAMISRSFRFEWFASISDFVYHMVGAVLMGIGGVLAMGCTVGQAITGVSTLALGSILTFGSIVFGSALTMKTQYYKMLYEDASFIAAFTTALVELKLLPASMRKLEAL